MTKTLSGGSFQSASGTVIASGKLILTLSQDAMILAGGQVKSSIPVVINLDANGDVAGTPVVYGNDELSPSGTFYYVDVLDSSGNTIREQEKWVLTGTSPINLDTIVPTLLNPDPGFANPVLQNPTAAQTITGQALTLTSSAPLTVHTEIVAKLDNILFVDGVTYAATMAGLQAAHDALTSSGGTIIIPPGTYSGTATVNFTKPVVLQGAGWDATTIQLTTTGTNLHAISTTKNLTIRDCGFTVQTPPATNLSMSAIRVDTTVGGVGPNLSYLFDNLKIRGFNLGINIDGRGSALTAFNVDSILVQNSDIQIAGPTAATAVNTLLLSGSNFVDVHDNILDNNNKGDHVVYLIQDKVVLVHHNRIQNSDITVGNNSQGIKASMQTPNASGVYPLWSFTDNEITNVGGAILVGPSDTAIIDTLRISGNTIRTVKETTATDYAVHINPTQTSTIANIVLSDNKFEDLQQGAILLDGGAGTIIRNVAITNTFVRDFSKASSGTHNAVSQSTPGSVSGLLISGLRVDGTSTGRAAYNFVGVTISRLQVLDYSETAVTGVSAPIQTILTARVKASGGTALVAGDFALHANWGSGATVSAITGTDQAWQITVTAGTTPGANPTITLTFKDGTWTNAPICVTKQIGGTGVLTNAITEVPTATTNVITWNGTPVNGSTYIFASVAMGR